MKILFFDDFKLGVFKGDNGRRRVGSGTRYSAHRAA